MAVLTKVELSIKTDAERYRRAWTALVILGDVLQEHSWRGDLPKLEPEHIRGMSDGYVGQSEGNRTLSWIWKVRGVTAGDGEGETVLADGKTLSVGLTQAKRSSYSATRGVV